MGSLLVTIVGVTIDELAANREWLPGVRANWEAKSRLPALDQLPAATNEGLAQCMTRLLTLTLDYYTAAKGEIGIEEQDRYMNAAGVLGKEWTGVLDGLPAGERTWPLSHLSFYSDGIAHVVREAANDPRLAWFLGCVLLTWGAFFRRVEFP